MTTIQSFTTELENESKTTRKMLSIIPDDKFSWQPHPKSMSVKNLAIHIAEIPSWIGMVLNTSGLDFQKNPYKLPDLNSTDEILAFYEKNLQDGINKLKQARESQLEETWTLSNGDHVISEESKAAMIRTCFCQIVHHRAQLGVFLRLLDIPIPGSYGPSADEN